MDRGRWAREGPPQRDPGARQGSPASHRNDQPAPQAPLWRRPAHQRHRLRSARRDSSGPARHEHLERSPPPGRCLLGRVRSHPKARRAQRRDLAPPPVASPACLAPGSSVIALPLLHAVLHAPPALAETFIVAMRARRPATRRSGGGGGNPRGWNGPAVIQCGRSLTLRRAKAPRVLRLRTWRPITLTPERLRGPVWTVDPIAAWRGERKDRR